MNITNRPGKAEIILCAALCAFYFALMLLTSTHYGVTWDEPPDWYIAHRNIGYLLTLDSKWIDFGHNFALYHGTDHPELYFSEQPLWTLYFGNLMSSIGCLIFYEKLGWLGAVEAHHLPNFLLVAAVLVAMFAHIRRNFDHVAAVVACLAIAFQPRFFADTHFNTKDIPYACLMAFTLLAARRGIIRMSPCWIFAASVLWGLAACASLNAGLIPVVLLFWYICSRNDIKASRLSPPEDYNHKRTRELRLMLEGSPLIAFVAFVAVWPYLWTDTIYKTGEFLRYYFGVVSSGKGGIQWDTILLFLAVQPPAVLLFGGIGIASAIYNIIRRKNNEAGSFLLIWAVLPVLRMALPRVRNYDGVRHFIEYAVPLGALTGIGASMTLRWLAENIGKRLKRREIFGRILSGALVFAPFIPWAWTMIKIHPHELVYFNFIAGGAKGAQERWSDATDYWGSSYREGMKWLNENTERGAWVVVPIAGHIVMSTRQMWMRNDLRTPGVGQRISMDEFLGILGQAHEEPIYAMYITKKEWRDDVILKIESEWALRHSINVDGAPILKIYKMANSPQIPFDR